MKHPILTAFLFSLTLVCVTACGGSSSSGDDYDIDLTDDIDDIDDTSPDTEDHADDDSDSNDDGNGDDSVVEDAYAFTIDHETSGAIGAFGAEVELTMAGDGPTLVGHDGEPGVWNYRGFVSVDISGLSTDLMGVEVESGSLRIWVSEVEGSPVDTLGELYAWLTDYGDELTEDDYDSTTGIYNTSGGFSTGTGTGWRDIDVTGIVRAIVDNRDDIGDRVQFRLRHSFEPGQSFGVHTTSLCLEEDCGDEGGPAELVIETRDPF